MVEHRSKKDTLEQLLHDYRQNGVDSEGQFTLNAGRVRELLRQFQLPEAAQYVLHLLSFLVGAGATGISVRSSKTQLRFEAVGASLEEQAARSPFSALLGSNEPEPHLLELALGLNALTGVEGGEARIAYAGWEATYSSVFIEVKEHNPTDHLSITTGPRLTDLSQEREIELIKETFAYCPVPITINGEPIPQPPEPATDCGLEIHLRNGHYPLRLQNDAATRKGWRSGSSMRLTKPIGAGFSALLRIGREAPGFRVIHLGRLYEMPLPWTYDVPGWRVDITISSDRLKKDLSQQAILENAQYQNLLKSLRLQLEFASIFLLSKIPPSQCSDELVDDLVEYLFHSGKSEQALKFQRALAQHFSQQSDSLQKGKAFYRLALMERDQAHSPSLLEKGREVLATAAETEIGQSRRSRFAADMAFAEFPRELQAELSNLLTRQGEPGWFKERCCRWFLQHSPPEDKAGYRVRLARLVFEAGRPLEALAHLEEAAAEGYGDPGEEARATELRAEIAAERGHLAESLKLFESHLTALRDRYGQHSLRLGLTLVRMAKLLDHLGESKQARSYREWSKNLYLNN